MPLIGGVVVTHGNLATELVSAAETIINEDIHHITAVTIGWHDDVEIARDEIGKAIERDNQGVGVLVLTDMFGGTSTPAPWLTRSIALPISSRAISTSSCQPIVTAVI